MKFSLSPLREFINGIRQFTIAIRYFVPCVMRTQLEAHGVPGVCPRGMMVHLFGNNGNFCHEAKSLCEIFERESLLEAIVFFFPLHTYWCLSDAIRFTIFSGRKPRRVVFIGRSALRWKMPADKC